MAYYFTDENRFYNPFAMFAYAAYNTPNAYPNFYFNDTEFSRCDWTIDLSASFDKLMEARAVQLREKYDKLVLFFSGGTDSMTVYNVFRRLGIFIDEIVTTYHDDLTLGYSPEVCDWLLDNAYDKRTKLTFLNRAGVPIELSTVREDFLTNPKTIFTFTNMVIHSNASRISDYDLMHRELGINAGIITGLEKPHLIFDGVNWFSVHLDKLYIANGPWFDEQNIENFFVTPDMPELHISQSHLLKNNVITHLGPTSRWVSSRWGDESWQNFQLLSTWSGRDLNLILSNAMYQKAAQNGVAFNAASLIDHSNVHTLNELPSDRLTHHYENDTVNRVLDALRYIQSDSKIIEYMKRCKLVDSEVKSIDRYNGIYGKSYKLTKGEI